jgi:hypothetical protein
MVVEAEAVAAGGEAKVEQLAATDKLTRNDPTLEVVGHDKPVRVRSRTLCAAVVEMHKSDEVALRRTMCDIDS